MAAPVSVFLLLSVLALLPTVEVAKKSSRHLLQDIKDAKEFKKLLRTHNNVMVVFVQSDKEGNKQMKLYEDVAEEMKGSAKFAYVNCGDDKKMCKKLKVNPKSGVELKHYKDGDFNKDYDRMYTVKSMVNFLRDPTGDIPWDEDSEAVNVVHLDTPGSLNKLLGKEKRPVLIMFYAPWCGFCKRLKPDYAQAATALKGHSVLAGMDVDKPENMAVRQDYNITGFPTIYYFENGRIVYKYGGENNKDGIVKWMKDPAPPKEAEKEAEWKDEESDVAHLGDDTFDDFLAANPSVLVMFYAPWCGHCKKMKPEFTEAAATMKEEEIEGTLAGVDATQAKGLGERFAVKGYPTVKYFKDGKEEFDFNERTADKIVEFMRDPQEPPPPPPPEPAWEETESEVLHLKDDDTKKVLKKKKHTLVMFYAPWCGHCKKAKPEFMNAAAQFTGDNKVAFAAIDCTQHQTICAEYEVQGYPTFHYFNYGKNSQKYTGGREESDFVAFMKDPLNPLASAPPPAPSPESQWEDVEGNELIHHLNEANFDSFVKKNPSVLVMFYAPWCGHCKAMKPAYGEAALLMKKDAALVGVLAAVDATVDRNLGNKFDVKGYPTIKYFKDSVFAFDYDKPRTTAGIMDFMSNPVKPVPPPVEEKWSDVPSDVLHLTTQTFAAQLAGKDALVMFYAPWCGHCKKAKPEFSAAAEAIKDQADKAFAAVDCTVEKDICNDNEVKGYPTIKHFADGVEVSKYEGGRSKDSFVGFMSALSAGAKKEEL